MKLSIVAGATSQSVNVFIQDSSSTTGAGLTGLVYNTSGLTAYYTFAGANTTATQITLATLSLVTSAWSSGGFKEIDATNMPGWYRLDLPNAVLATSKGRSVGIHLKGAANMAPCPIEIELTGWDNQNATTGGLGNLDAAVSSRSTYAGADTSGTTTLLSRLTSGRATNLDNLDAAISTRSTYAGADTAGTATLLGRLTSGRATNLDNLDATISSRAPASTALTNATWTDVRAGNLDNLDAMVSSRQSTGAAASQYTTIVSTVQTYGAVVVTGTAAAGGASTITLGSALGHDDIITGNEIVIQTGTGVYQSRTITDYVDATKVATVDRPWAVQPDATSVYQILKRNAPALDGSLRPTAASVAGNVGGSVNSVATTVNATLVSTGLDAISTANPASGVFSSWNFRERLVMLARRFLGKATLPVTVTPSGVNLQVFADDGTTVVAAQTMKDDGTTQTQGASL